MDVALKRNPLYSGNDQSERLYGMGVSAGFSIGYVASEILIQGFDVSYTIIEIGFQYFATYILQNAPIAPAPAVDALLYVADVKKAAKPVLSVSGDDFFDERTHDLVLRDVGVLKLVD